MGVKIIIYDYSVQPPEIANVDSPELTNYFNNQPNHKEVEVGIQEPNFQPIVIGKYFKLGA